MNIAVTGGAGQLGAIVVRRLLANRKNKQVLCLDVRPPPLPELGRLRYVKADVRDPALAEHLAGIDAVVHLAFVVTGWLPRADFDAINIGGSKNVFEAAARAGVKQVVYASSIAAYGVVPGHPVPIVEDTPRRLQDDFPYSAAKFKIEAFLDEFEPKHPELAIARLRPSVLIGARMEHPLGDALRAGLMPDTGGSRMPVVWDEDVADAVLLCLEQGARGAFLLNADDNQPPEALARAVGLRHIRIPVGAARAVVTVVGRIQRARGKPASDPAWLDGRGDVVMDSSSEKAKRVLGWKPRCPTAVDVLRHYIDTVPHRLDRRLSVFFTFVGLAARRNGIPEEHRNVSSRIHLSISGRNGGDVGLILEAGRLTITRVAPRPPTSIVRLSADTLLAMLAGELDGGSALLTGKIELDGDPTAGLFLNAIVSTFRAQRARPGVDGFVARRLGRWLARKEARG
jgi:nucleoside-diphosphate-sugar epimerase/putative sterol carrier protein